MDLREVKIGSAIAIVRLIAAVNQYAAVGCGEQERRPANFTAAAEHGNPRPLVLFWRVLSILVFGRDVPVDPPPDGAQELFPFLIYRAEVLTDLFDGGALDRGGSVRPWESSRCVS